MNAPVRCHASRGTHGKRDPDRDGRASLRALLLALDASPLSVRRDFWRGMGRRGDYAVRGKRGLSRWRRISALRPLSIDPVVVCGETQALILPALD